MATTSWKGAGTGASIRRTGSDIADNWTNPGNITADDTSDSRADITGDGSFSWWLVGSNFGFTTADIPSGNTIDGVEIRIKWQAEELDIDEDAIHIDTQATTDPPSSTNKSSGANVGTTESQKIFGGAADLWGETLSDSDVRGTGFSAWISVMNDKQLFSRWCDVNYVDARITHSAGVTYVDVAAALAGTGVLAPDVTRERAIVAALAGQAVLGADLNRVQTIIAALTGEGVLGADFNRVQTIIAALVGEAVIGPNMGFATNLAAALSGEAVLDPNLSLPADLVAALIGEALLAPNLSYQASISTGLVGEAVINPLLGFATDLSANLIGEAVIDPTMTFAANLVADLSGDAVLLPKLNRVQTLILSLDGTAVLDLVVTRPRGIATGLIGEGDLNARLDPGLTFVDVAIALDGNADLGLELNRVREISIALQGDAQINAALSQIRAIEANLTGVAVLSPDLTVTEDQVLGSYVPTFRPRRRP